MNSLYRRVYRRVYSSPSPKTQEEQELERKAHRRAIRKERRKRFKRQTIEGHKREILARLSVPEGSLRKAKLVESSSHNRIWVSLILTVRAPRNRYKDKLLSPTGKKYNAFTTTRQGHIQDLCYQVAICKESTSRIIRALYYLIDEGKLYSSIDPLEWKVQQSLGIPLTREIFLAESLQNLPGVSSI